MPRAQTGYGGRSALCEPAVPLSRLNPFCSKRGADGDLHRWLKGGYVIPDESAGPKPGDEDE